MAPTRKSRSVNRRYSDYVEVSPSKNVANKSGRQVSIAYRTRHSFIKRIYSTLISEPSGLVIELVIYSFQFTTLLFSGSFPQNKLFG